LVPQPTAINQIDLSRFYTSESKLTMHTTITSGITPADNEQNTNKVTSDPKEAARAARK